MMLQLASEKNSMQYQTCGVPDLKGCGFGLDVSVSRPSQDRLETY